MIVPTKDLDWLDVDSGAGKDLRDNKAQHNQQVLAGFLHKPRRGQQDNDDIKPQHHGEQLSLQDGKVESRDDDICKCPKPARRQGGEDLDTAVAPHLGITKGFPHLVCAELLVLQTCLVGADSFDHFVLVFLAETFGSHGGIGHPEEDEASPDHRKTAICHEQSLP